MLKEFLTGKEVLKRLGLSQPTWWRLNKRGDGPPRIQVSPNIWIYPADAFEQWLANRNQTQQPAE